MGRRLEHVGPDEVEKMNESVFASEAEDSQSHVFDGGAGGLPMDEITVHQRVFEQRDDGVDVILAHFSDVFEEEGERFENAVLDVQLGNSIFVHESREDGERRTGLGDDSDGDRRTDAVLSLLDLQVVEKCGEDVVRTDRFSDVTERVDGGATNGLLGMGWVD